MTTDGWGPTAPYLIGPFNATRPTACQDLHNIVKRQLRIGRMSPPDMRSWTGLAKAVDSVSTPVKIAIVGKYTGLQDSYLSVIKVRLRDRSGDGDEPPLPGASRRAAVTCVISWCWTQSRGIVQLGHPPIPPSHPSHRSFWKYRKLLLSGIVVTVVESSVLRALQRDFPLSYSCK